MDRLTLTTALLLALTCNQAIASGVDLLHAGPPAHCDGPCAGIGCVGWASKLYVIDLAHTTFPSIHMWLSLITFWQQSHVNRIFT